MRKVIGLTEVQDSSVRFLLDKTFKLRIARSDTEDVTNHGLVNPEKVVQSIRGITLPLLVVSVRVDTKKFLNN